MTWTETQSPTREWITDSSGRVLAVVSPLAASLRMLIIDGMDAVEPTVDSTALVHMSGAMLLPWPNRVEDARWRQGATEYQLEVNEPELNNANHGLLADHVFDIVHRESRRVDMAATIRHAKGYPFDLDALVSYRVDARGLTVNTTLTNVGRERAPVAVGAHPYLRVGDTRTDSLSLRIDATHGYHLDERNIPRETFRLSGSPEDLRVETPVRRAPRHMTYMRADTGRTLTHSLRTSNGRGVELWADPDFRWTQLYVSPSFPAAAGTHEAVAVEPMTAPPNALRTGEGLRWLDPDESWSVSWGLRTLPGTGDSAP